jgi:hypothetical protein
LVEQVADQRAILGGEAGEQSERNLYAIEHGCILSPPMGGAAGVRLLIPARPIGLSRTASLAASCRLLPRRRRPALIPSLCSA